MLDEATRLFDIGDSEGSSQLQFIAFLCTIGLNFENFDITVFPDAALRDLETNAPNITNSEISARIYETLSIEANSKNLMRKFFEYRVKSSRAYLESATKAFNIKNIEPSKLNFYIEQRLQKAMDLAATFRRQNPKIFNDAVTTIEQRIHLLVDKSVAQFKLDEVIHVSNLMKILIDNKQGDPKINLSIIDSTLNTLNFFLNDNTGLVGNKDKYYLYVWKSAYLELRAQWQHLDGDFTSKIQSFKESVLTRAIQMVDQGLKSGTISYGYAVMETTHAINLLNNVAIRPASLRDFGQFDTETELLNKRLLDFQKRANAEPAMTSSPEFEILRLKNQGFSHEDAYKLFNDGRIDAEGKSFEEILSIILARTELLPDDAYLRSLTEENQTFIPSIVINMEAMQKGIADPTKNPENAISKLIYANARNIHGLQSAYILGLLTVAKEDMQVLEIPEFLLNSSFIRPERRELYKLGINSFLNGDFVTSMHLLIPQVEDSLRYILIQLGEISSNLTAEEIQARYTLNNLLYNQALSGPLEQFFGPEVILNLKSLLVERFGSNLRNNILHGLIKDNQIPLTLKESVYLNWIILKMADISTARIGVNKPLPAIPVSGIYDVIDQSNTDFLEGVKLLDKISYYKTILNLTARVKPGFSNIHRNANLTLGTLVGLNQTGFDFSRFGQTLLFTSSQFIPDFNRNLWIIGLTNLLEGNLLEAAHFLIPQVEESLRDILEQNGEITSMLIEDIQDDFTLGKLIQTHRAKLNKLLGEDTLNDLELLLVSNQYGLRNRLAHGLLELQDFTSGEVVHLLGLTLKICVDKVSRILRP